MSVHSQVRVLMVSEETQMIIHKKPMGGGLSAVGGNSEYTYYEPGCAEYAHLEQCIKDSTPRLLEELDLRGEPLPVRAPVNACSPGGHL